jgi:hypothetical protein
LSGSFFKEFTKWDKYSFLQKNKLYDKNRNYLIQLKTSIFLSGILSGYLFVYPKATAQRGLYPSGIPNIFIYSSTFGLF